MHEPKDPKDWSIRLLGNWGYFKSRDGCTVIVYLSYISCNYTFTVRTTVTVFTHRLMSTQTNYPADTLQHRLYPHLQSDDSKDSCDTLIDVNGQPYTPNSRHQTFTIGTPTTSRLERGFSIPLTKISSKLSDDTHETSSSQPPVVTQPSELDVPSLWQRVVDCLSSVLSAFLTCLTRLSPSPLLAVFMLQQF